MSHALRRQTGAAPPRLPSRPQRSAFTLVEVLVVVGILAVLVGILLPVIGGARRQADAAVCASNLRTITAAALLYAQDTGRFVAYVPAKGPKPALDRKELLFPYIKHGANNADVHGNQVWTCPANERVELEASYGFNINLNGIRLERVRKPVETAALCDAGLMDVPVGGPSLATHCWPPGRPGSASSCRPNHTRHPNKSACVAFLDGHVERLPVAPPFYAGPVGTYTPLDLKNYHDPKYQDTLWDLY